MTATSSTPSRRRHRRCSARFPTRGTRPAAEGPAPASASLVYQRQGPRRGRVDLVRAQDLGKRCGLDGGGERSGATSSDRPSATWSSSGLPPRVASPTGAHGGVGDAQGRAIDILVRPISPESSAAASRSSATSTWSLRHAERLASSDVTSTTGSGSTRSRSEDAATDHRDRVTEGSWPGHVDRPGHGVPGVQTCATSGHRP